MLPSVPASSREKMEPEPLYNLLQLPKGVALPGEEVEEELPQGAGGGGMGGEGGHTGWTERPDLCPRTVLGHEKAA